MNNHFTIFAAKMKLIDTHTHLYLDTFDPDRPQVIRAAMGNGVERMLLPNIDSSTIESMHAVCSQFPEVCLPMIGLHPTSVGPDYQEELERLEAELEKTRYIAVGEIGIDLYWDRTFEKEQEQAFRHQIALALEHELPIVIHSRQSIDRILSVLTEMDDLRPRGVFHCFSGSLSQAIQIIDLGFYLGIGGVLTFNKSTLAGVVRHVGLEHLLLETDAPFLAPDPFRGKRNESAYLPLIARKLAEVTDTSVETVASVTTANARELFHIPY